MCPNEHVVSSESKLQQLLDELTHKHVQRAVLVLNQNVELLAAEGDLKQLALDQLQPGDDVREHIPMLYQVHDLLDQNISFVQLPSGVIADIFITRFKGDFMVGLVAAEKQHRALQQQQQKTNELSLLQREQAVTLDALRQAHQQLQLQSDELDRLYSAQQHYLNSLSHEVRNPLQAMLATLHADTPLDQDDNARLQRATQQLLTLVENLLVQGQSEQFAMPTVQQIIDLPELLGDCVQLLQPSAIDKGLRLELDIDPALSNVNWSLDGSRLRQILFNLIGNAIRYTNTGGIEVLTGLTESRLLIMVKDTGPGIAADEQSDMFNAYQRGRQNNGHGAGLGLTISRELAQAMGGELSLHSKLGRGSTFELSLPARHPQSSVMAELSNGTSVLPTIPGCAVLVDDDVDLRTAIANWLNDWGVQVRQYADLSSFKQILNEASPDWLLLDQQLPEGSGTTMIPQITERWPRCKIVILSGDAIELPATMPVEILRKPVTKQTLHQILSASR